ncbi:MAG: NapC/NirT family cytochrome c [Gammaproteobacteria bacterium]|nr:MAG: NapC/NirT family cytochrome c [Gammaproteobacteria bacterium]
MGRLSKKVTLVLFAGGLLIGMLFWSGLHSAVEVTNSLEFCVSCHELSQVYAEYRQSPHYKNAAGVRAVCADCHVPKPWWPKMKRKMQAANDLYHKVRGSIGTPEKFEARRLQLAERVWQRMRENDSRECRSCHSFDYMDFHKQRRRSAEKMQKVINQQTGETCIDCHKGIAHKLPDDYDEDDD